MTAEELGKREGVKQRLKAAGFPETGTPEWYEKLWRGRNLPPEWHGRLMRENETREEWAKRVEEEERVENEGVGNEALPELDGIGVLIGEPTTLGELMPQQQAEGDR